MRVTNNEQQDRRRWSDAITIDEIETVRKKAKRGDTVTLVYPYKTEDGRLRYKKKKRHLERKYKFLATFAEGGCITWPDLVIYKRHGSKGFLVE